MTGWSRGGAGAGQFGGADGCGGGTVWAPGGGLNTGWPSGDGFPGALGSGGGGGRAGINSRGGRGGDGICVVISYL